MSISVLSPTKISTTSVHSYSIRALDSADSIRLSDYAGKKILIVNVASKCGFTGQYADLEALYQEYQDQLVIIGVPCNQFLFQEPGDESKIANFCSMNYGVTFPLTEKAKVRGKDAHPIYKWLTSAHLNGKANHKVKWNFNKFLIDENGELLAYFPSKVKPLDKAITDYLD